MMFQKIKAQSLLFAMFLSFALHALPSQKQKPSDAAPTAAIFSSQDAQNQQKVALQDNKQTPELKKKIDATNKKLSALCADEHWKTRKEIMSRAIQHDRVHPDHLNDNYNPLWQA